MIENFSIEAAAVSITILAAALSGCASLPDAGSPTGGDGRDPRPVRAEMQLRHALPAISTDPSDAPEEMLAGNVQLGAPKGLIDYGARYQVRQGKFFRAIRDGDGDLAQAQSEVALQTVEQTLGSTLHLPAFAPVTLQLTRREDTRLGADNGSTRQSTRADLRWSPGLVDLHLEWTRPDPATKSGSGVNCDLRAGLQLPTEFLPAPAGSVIELSGQRCRGSSPAHGVADLALAHWEAAWRWGTEQNTALRVLRTEPEMPAGVFAPLMPDYELGLSHSHLLPGGWQAQADVSALRAGPVDYTSTAQTGTDGTDWSARVALSRQLNLLAVSARWAHAAERAWFATATKQLAGDRFSLALDFGTWLTRLWPRGQSAMDVSWDWRRTRQGDTDSKVSWNMLIDW